MAIQQPSQERFDSSGNLLVNVAAGGGAGGTSSTFGADIPGTGTAIGVQNPSGKMVTLLVDGSGNLKTTGGGGGGGGTSSVDEAAFTAGVDSLTLSGTVFNDSLADLTSGQGGVQRSTAKRAVHVNLRNIAGTEIGTASTPLRTDPTGSTIQPVSGTVTASVTGTVTANAGTNLNTSALALETGGNLASIKSNTDKIPSQGQALAAASTPVVLTAAQITTLTPPTNTGYATSALQTTGNTSVGNIDTKTPALGQALAAASVPVVLTAAQLSTLTPLSTIAATQSGTWNITTLTTVTTVSTVTNLSQMSGQAIAMGTGARSAGTQRVTIATDDVVPSSQSGTWTVQPGNTANTTPWLVSEIPATAGGCLISRTLSANNTTGISVKGSAGQIFGIIATNVNAAARFLKIYNTSSPTVGTTTPAMTIPIPGNTSGAGLVFTLPSGIAFGTSIGIGITTGVADNDTGAPAANEVVVNILYK